MFRHGPRALGDGARGPSEGEQHGQRPGTTSVRRPTLRAAHGPGQRLADRVRAIGAIRASLLLPDQRLETAAVEAEIAAEQDRADRERAEREAATQTSSNTPPAGSPPPASAPSLPSPPPGGSDGATQAIAFAKAQFGEPYVWGTTSDSIHHVAMYLGDGQIVHAPRTGRPVSIDSMYSWTPPDFFARV